MLTIPTDFGAFVLEIATSNTFQQIFPLFIIFFVPFSVLYITRFSRPSASLSSLFYSVLMVLEGLGFTLPWNWGNSSSHVSTNNHKKKGKKTAARAEKLELQSGGDACNACYPGLVNISGTYCFMNSTVQALSSLSYLQPHIDATHARAEALDVPSPVIDALQDLCHTLNDPRSRPSSIRPLELISVLSSAGRTNTLLSSREHQDAQELFQLLSECLKSEITAIDKESARDRGLGGGLSQEVETKISKSVFDGLTANRRSCVVCGYTEAVMHFAFDNWQLAVPRMASTCLLEDCLSEYTRLEVLRDCICRKCSMTATLRRLTHEIQALTEVPNPSSSKKKRLKDVKKMAAKVKAALDEGRVEDELKDVRMEKVISISTKQAMIARPPPVLVLHINRSMHFTNYAAKNNIRVVFPEVLDLTPFTTSGNLSTVPTSSLSTPSPQPRRSTTPTPEPRNDSSSRTIYRLSAVVCHYGQHSFGHYICYRRKPKSGSGEAKWRPPKLVIELSNEAASSPLGREFDSSDNTPTTQDQQNEEDAEGFEEYIWEDADPSTAAGTGKGWLRVSDDAVIEVGIESVLQEGSGAFMLYYERAVISGIVQAGVGTGGGTSPYPSGTAMGTGNGVPVMNGFASGMSLKNSSSSSTSTPLTNGYPVGVGVGVGTPLNSEETLRPQRTMTMMMNGNGSIGSLVSVDEKGFGIGEKERDRMSFSSSMSVGGSSPPVFGARVVRNTAVGRSRSLSAAPAMKKSPSSSTPGASSSTSMLSPTSSTYLPLSSSQPIAMPMPNGRSPARFKEEDLDVDRFDDVVDDGDADTSSSLSTNSNRSSNNPRSRRSNTTTATTTNHTFSAFNDNNNNNNNNYNYNSDSPESSSLSFSSPTLMSRLRPSPMSISNTSITSLESVGSYTSSGGSAVSVQTSSVVSAASSSSSSSSSSGSSGSRRGRGRGRSVQHSNNSPSKSGGSKGRSPQSRHPPLGPSSSMVGLKA
ncbi:hypothetical protein D9757_014855 [Collybiopsis confluens]|uniref:ubiquitinyl hydrolase 1 n=1 Tax=Collybiopsis confluens TaxID=2823264 RepID=A0A8H5CF65_9AGAR|nr:hypothetical protein D9757_014855 [Collybiopsis confluens]